jgi:hypothetical protein
MEAFTYRIICRKAGETKTYIRVGDARVSALSSDMARLGYRVTVQVMS